MKKMILNLVLILGLAGSVGIAEEVALKECKNEQDKMSGCVAKKYIKEVFGMGKFLIETPYKNGRREGIVKAYDENGNLLAETPYKNGEIEGIAKSYYKNGNLLAETPYKNGEIEGIQKVYDENGNLLAKIPLKNDIRDGTMKLYYANGGLIASLTYKGYKFISGKCANGKVLTTAHLHNIGRDMGNINDICKNRY